MMKTSDYLNKQASFLLQKPVYAWLLTGFLALFPFTGWLSLAVMALVTLRSNWLDGIRCLIVGLTVSICFAEVIGRLPEALDTIVPTYLLCYGCACVLRRAVSWQSVAIFCMSVAVGIIFGVHWFFPQYLLDQYQALLQIISAFDQEHLVGQLFSHQRTAMQLKYAHYLFGIKVVSVILSAIVPLMLARSIQSSLYYPGGFKQEIINFRAHSMGSVLLLLTIFGAYQHNLLSITCLPVFFIYLMMAGISLIFNLLSSKKKLVIYVSLFLPIVIIPYVVLPAYVLFGSIDSVFNLRSRQSLYTHSD